MKLGMYEGYSESKLRLFLATNARVGGELAHAR
jgi:hypothetical protein